MTRRLTALILILTLGPALAAAPAAGQTPVRRRAADFKDLAPAHQQFLTLAAYIINPKEREVFLELPDGRDRDLFIEAFWKLRDPTPETPANEYKEEMLKRFGHVNKHFASSRPGWMTDRGRIWMILGEPSSTDRYPGKTGLVPCEVWYYSTDGSKGLPSYFGLVFFQKKGAGEYRLYDPFIDGPLSLLEPMASTRTLDPNDYETLYETIGQYAPALAGMSISLIPGEFGYGYQPTSRSTELLAQITESPYKGLNPSYATHFLDYKGLVSTEYLTNYIENEGLAGVLRDPVLGLSFVHFSVAPQKISVDYYEPKDQYFCDFKIDVSLRRGEEIVFQYATDFPLYFAPSDMDRVRQNGVALEDDFPVGEGTYKLTVLVRNSVAKEFTVMERTLQVPAPGGRPSLDGPFLGYQTKNLPADVLVPFKTGTRKLVVDPKTTFASGDEIDVLFSVADLSPELWRDGRVELNVRGLGRTPVLKTFTVRLAESPYDKVLSLSPNIAAPDLAADYYELTLRLRAGDGRVLDEKITPFVISGEKAIAHPVAHSKGFPLANGFYLHYQLARQYDKLNMKDRAAASYARGFAMNPGYQEGVAEYARFLVRMGDFDKALTVVEGLRGVEKGRYDYHLVRGLAAMGKEDYGAAIDDLTAANRIYNSDKVLLNALGSCFLKTGRKAQALTVFEASLKLDGAQPDIRKIVQDLGQK